MAIYPHAARKLIPAPDNDPPIHAVGAILHVAVTSAPSLHDYFDGRSGGIESHFYVDLTGRVEQYRDTAREADANLEANSFTRDGHRVGFISIETAGFEHGVWNPPQLESIKDLLAWAAAEHGFPLRPCPGPFEPGVGYHVMWGAPGPWTPVAKTCPGPDRVRQFERVLVPWMRNPDDQEDDVTKDNIAAITEAVLKATAVRNRTVEDADAAGAFWTLPQALSWVEERTERLEATLKDVTTKLDALLAHVTAGPR